MSKNITIQEGGVAKQLSVDKLKTNLANSGTCLWVPEDEVQLTTKTITENGAYKASDDGYYGYSEVVVNVAGSGMVSGTDPTTGEDVVVTTDPQTGEIVETTVPHSIRIVTPPYNQFGIYTNGQAITKDGMEVRALLASGDLYDATGYPNGLIPNNEITLNPTTATYDESTDHGTIASSDLFPDGISVASSMEAHRSAPDSPYIVTRDASPGSTLFVIQERDGAIAKVVKCSDSNVFDPSQSYIHNGKTVYYRSELILDSLYTVYPTPIVGSARTYDEKEAAWTAIYGTISRAGSRQQITTSWPRPLDGKVLETTFEILVAPPYSSGEE